VTAVTDYQGLTPQTEVMTKTVGEMAKENPSSVRVFEKYGIDYCCRGKVSLSEACEARGIASAELQAELDLAATPKTGAERDWSGTPLALLIDHIVGTHHVYLKSELPRLRQLLGKVRDAHGESLEPLVRIFDALHAELDAHLAKEEMVLFPLIKGMETAQQAGRRAPTSHCGSVNNPIAVMEHEHDNAGRALEALRQATCNYTLPADACNSYRALYFGLRELEADLHQHIHLENNILFPRAAELEAAFV
jgi:regulator of cell morphogenesis and NO signaling